MSIHTSDEQPKHYISRLSIPHNITNIISWMLHLRVFVFSPEANITKLTFVLFCSSGVIMYLSEALESSLELQCIFGDFVK